MALFTVPSTGLLSPASVPAFVPGFYVSTVMFYWLTKLGGEPHTNKRHNFMKTIIPREEEACSVCVCVCV